MKAVVAHIGRWAPTNENNTAAYVRAVEASTGTRPGAEVDLTTPAVMQGFVTAIIRHENAGYACPDAALLEGVPKGAVVNAVAWRAISLVVLIAIACFATWKVQDWRYGQQLAELARLTARP